MFQLAKTSGAIHHPMKKLLLTLALVAVAPFADAQGTIQLANNLGTRFRLCVIPPPDVPGPVGGTFVFGVYFGISADSLSAQPAGPLATNSSTGGLISGPSAGAYPIPGHREGETVFIQIRGWEARFPTWEAGQTGLRGQTTVKPFVLGPESLAPGTVIWSATDPTKFQAIDMCPEPSAIVLVGLGLGGLFLLRRKLSASR